MIGTKCTLLVKLLSRTKIAGVRTSELIKPHLGTNRSQESVLENDWYQVSLESTLCSLTVLTCEHSLEKEWFLGVVSRERLVPSCKHLS
nr:hypothetical protein Cbor_402 [Cedratvirus borely]